MGVIYKKQGLYECYGYDYNLFYLRIMTNKNLQIPFRQGKEMTITEIADDIYKIKVGFYRAHIVSNDENFKKVFSFSHQQTYTHTSLMFAIKHKDKFNVTINLIQDDKPNCYIYDDKYVITGYETFGQYADIMIKLKDLFPKNALVKHLCSSIGGNLSRKNVTYKTYDEIEREDLDVGITDDHQYRIISHNFHEKKDGTEYEEYELLNTHSPYALNIRLLPFVTAYGRNKIGRLVMKDIGSVVRVYCDSICFTRKQEFDSKEDALLDYKNLKLESKSTGLIHFDSSNEYLNFTYEMEKTIERTNKHKL
jgi:hypothetical protein